MNKPVSATRLNKCRDALLASIRLSTTSMLSIFALSNPKRPVSNRAPVLFVVRRPGFRGLLPTTFDSHREVGRLTNFINPSLAIDAIYYLDWTIVSSCHFVLCTSLLPPKPTSCELMSRQALTEHETMRALIDFQERLFCFSSHPIWTAYNA